MFTDNILARILNQIAKADLIIADMTERNPNVFYETGYAHALGKTVILLTLRSDDIPFDLRQYPHIVYADSLVTLRDQLIKKVRFFLEHPNVNPRSGAWSLQLFQNGRMLQDGGVLEGKVTYNGFLSVVIEVHNPTPQVFHGQRTTMALLYVDTMMREVHSKERSVKLPDGRLMTTLTSLANLYPDEWLAYRFDVKAFESRFQVGDSMPVTLRIYSAMGPLDLTLSLEAVARVRAEEADEEQ